MFQDDDKPAYGDFPVIQQNTNPLTNAVSIQLSTNCNQVMQEILLEHITKVDSSIISGVQKESKINWCAHVSFNSCILTKS